MNHRTVLPLNLQFFADGEGGGAGGSGTQGAGQAPGNGQQGNAASVQQQGYRNIARPGEVSPADQAALERAKQKVAARNQSTQQTTTQATETKAPTTDETQQTGNDPDAEWKSVREKFKDRIGQETAAAIKDRLKNHADVSKQFNEYQQGVSPVLQTLGQLLGVDPADPAALNKALLSNDSLFESIAAEKGITAHEAKMQFTQELQGKQRAEADEKLRADLAEANQRAALTQRAVKELPEVMQAIPGFNLEEEAANPDFAFFWHGGKTMLEAYKLAHINDIVNGALQRGAQQGVQKVAAAQQMNQSRPDENGGGGAVSGLKPYIPGKSTKADRDELVRRVERNGERIRF